MNKITFVNGSEPAINATNLNQLQTNIETEITNIGTEINNIETEITNIGTEINNIGTEINQINDKLQRTMLYEGAVVSGIITLTDNKDNYDKIEFYGTGNNLLGVIIPNKTGSQAVRLSLLTNSGTNTFVIILADCTAENNKVTINRNTRKTITTSITNDSSGLTIYRIVGYKY